MLFQSFRLFRLSLANEPTIKRNLAITVVLEIVSIILLYFLNGIYGDLYSGIQEYNATKIYVSMASFAGIAAVLVLVGGLVTFFMNKLAFGIRTGLNIFFVKKLDSLLSIDNVEQRIQEDLKNFGERSCEFWFAIFRSLLKLPIFIGIAITLTKWWVGLAVVLAVIVGTIAVKYAANSLIQLQSLQESNEATYRKSLSLGVFKDGPFLAIVTMFAKINTQVKRLSYLQSGLGQMFVLLPFFILIPLYLVKSISMGVLMQTANALGKVIESLTVLIEQRQLIVNISTCLKRMETLEFPDVLTDKPGNNNTD